MNRNTVKILQRAGESLSKLETMSLLRMTRLPRTKDSFTGDSNEYLDRCMKHCYSTTSSRRYGLDELIPKSPTLPIVNSGEADTGSSDIREKLAQQHQTSNATVVGTFLCVQ